MVLARTVEVSSIRCRSPVDSVAPARSSLQVAESDVEQRLEHRVQLPQQAGRQSGQLVRQGRRQVAGERAQRVQREGADLGEVASAQPRGQRLRPQPGPVADGARPGHDEPRHRLPRPRVGAAQRPLGRRDRVVVVDRQRHLATGAGSQRDPPLHRRTLEDRASLRRGQRAERRVQRHTQLRCHISGQPPAALVPGQHRTVLNGLARIRDERVRVDLGTHAEALAGRAGADRVEREELGARVFEVDTAGGADQLRCLGRDGRRDQVAVRAAVRAEPRHHQPQHVEDLAHRADRAARPRDRWALAQCQRGWQVGDPVDVGPFGLLDPPPAVGAQPLQEAVHPLGVEGAAGQRGLARAGHADDRDGPPQRDVDVQVAQVVVAHAADLDGPRQPVRDGRPRQLRAGSSSVTAGITCSPYAASVESLPSCWR